MLKISVCLLILSLLLFLGVNSAFSHGEFQHPEVTEGQITGALGKIVPLRLLPGNPLHLLILTKESALRLLTPSASKRAEHDLVISGKRLKEAYLLTKKGDIKNASEALSGYSKSLDRFNKQLTKAKSQNLDVEKLIEVSADIYEAHAVLLSAIYQIREGQTNGYNFNENVVRSVDSLKNSIELINLIKPGLKNRFPELFGN